MDLAGGVDVHPLADEWRSFSDARPGDVDAVLGYLFAFRRVTGLAASGVHPKARFYRNAEEMFALTSWVEVMIGQRILPRTYHPAVDQLSDAELRQLVEGVQRVIAACVEAMPMHQQFIARHCAAV